MIDAESTGAGAAPLELHYQVPPVDPEVARRRRRGLAASLLIACVLVALAWVGTFVLFDAVRLRTGFAYVRGNETVPEQALHALVLRLFLCWVWTLLVGGAGILMSGRRATFGWIGVALLVGLLSAGMWAATPYGAYVTWLRPFKWPKVLANVLLVLLLAAHLALATGAVQDRRFRPRPLVTGAAA